MSTVIEDLRESGGAHDRSWDTFSVHVRGARREPVVIAIGLISALYEINPRVALRQDQPMQLVSVCHSALPSCLHIRAIQSVQLTDIALVSGAG
jgi:hypothetical protein